MICSQRAEGRIESFVLLIMGEDVLFTEIKTNDEMFQIFIDSVTYYSDRQ